MVRKPSQRTDTVPAAVHARILIAADTRAPLAYSAKIERFVGTGHKGSALGL